MSPRELEAMEGHFTPLLSTGGTSGIWILFDGLRADRQDQSQQDQREDKFLGHWILYLKFYDYADAHLQSAEVELVGPVRKQVDQGLLDHVVFQENFSQEEAAWHGNRNHPGNGSRSLCPWCFPGRVSPLIVSL